MSGAACIVIRSIDLSNQMGPMECADFVKTHLLACDLLVQLRPNRDAEPEEKRVYDTLRSLHELIMTDRTIGLLYPMRTAPAVILRDANSRAPHSTMYPLIRSVTA